MPNRTQPVIRVLFGHKPDWFDTISDSLAGSRFQPHMARLDQVTLSHWDLVVPMTLLDQDILQHLSAPTRIARSVPAPVRALCNDKLLLNQWLIANGYAGIVPKMYDSPPDDPRLYPLVRKARRRSWGLGSRIVHNRREASALNARAEFLQAVVSPGCEWAAHMVFYDGALIFSHGVRHRMAQPGLILGNRHRPEESFDHAEIPHLQLWCDLAAALGITDGTICIDFAELDGRPYLYEVNPRFGGSLLNLLPDYLERQMQVLPQVAQGLINAA